LIDYAQVIEVHSGPTSLRPSATTKCRGVAMGESNGISRRQWQITKRVKIGKNTKHV